MPARIPQSEEFNDSKSGDKRDAKVIFKTVY